ncbi:unnamed protein product [Ilex paraguariensis]
MKKLRLLQINCVHLAGSFEHIFGDLRWLCWHYCPLKYLPSNFHLENLVALDMQHSNIKQLGSSIKSLKNLKVLNLSHSKFLTKTPDFTGVSRLETLLFENCSTLFEVHPSIGLLDRLTFFSLKDCENVCDLPSSICKLRSLGHLNITGCSNLKELPEHLGNMQCLTELLADGTAIIQLPFSCGLLKNLTTLSLRGCNQNLPSKSWFSLISSWVSPRRHPDSIRFLPPSISCLCFLRKLNVSDCNLYEGDIPADLGSLCSLEILDLKQNNFRGLPFSLCHLSKLHYLGLGGCKSLQLLTELPPNLRSLYADNCTSMEKLPNLSNYKRLVSLVLSDCRRLFEIEGLKDLNSLRMICLDSCTNLANAFKDSFFKGYSEHNGPEIFLPSGEIPDWFSYRMMGSSIFFDMPLDVEHKFFGMTLWAVFAAREEGKFTAAPYAIIYDKTNGGEWTNLPNIYHVRITRQENSRVSYVPKSYLKYPIKGGERIEVCFKTCLFLEVKKCGVHLIYNPDIQEHNEGQSLYTDEDVGTHEFLGYVNGKRSRNIDGAETSSNLEDRCSKRLRMEPDST